MKPSALIQKSILCLALSAAWQARAADEAVNQEQAESTLGAVVVQDEAATSFRSRTVQVGTFRDMEQLDVPLTANVVSRAVIEAQGSTSLYDALRNTAGVTRSQLNGATYDNIDIRGLLVNNVTNYRLNGALPIVNLIDLPLENKERVEVLKGASSLYYGFVPPSGVVNLVTKRAGDKPVTAVTGTVNNHGAATVHADVGRRFGEDDQFGMRMNLVGGTVDTGIDNFEGDRRLAAAALDWRATSDLSFKLDLEHIKKDVSEPPAIALLPASNGRIRLPSVPDNTTNLGGEWQKYDAEANNVLARADYAINADWGALVEAGRAVTRRDRNFSRFENYDLATGDGRVRIFFQQDGKWQNDNYRGEIYGRVATGPLTHDVSFGYTVNERDAESLNAPAALVDQNLFDPVDIARVGPTGAYTPFAQHIEDRGWYVFDRISIGESVQVMLGARSSDYESRTPTSNSEFSADEVTPQFSVLWKPQRWLSVYGSYLEGLEESGTAAANLDNAGETLEPALSRQREVGVKAEVARGMLLQAAYFEVVRPSTFVQNNRLTLNGEAEYKGIELAASGELTRDISLVASAIFMDARQTNRANTATYDKVPENTARRTASLFAEWRVPAVPGLALNAGVYYTGRRAVNNANQAWISGYTLGTLGARYATRIGGRAVTLQANLDNVTDKDYWNTAGNGLLGVGLPRTLKLTGTVAF